MTRLDGNALAGALSDVFGTDVTAAVGRCRSCGASAMIGETVVYPASPGFVIRCPHCDDVLAMIVESRDRIWLSLPGLTGLTIGRSDS